MGQETRVTDKGQTTIPKSLRERYDIAPGDRILWEESEDGIKVKKRKTSEGRGLLLSEDADEEERESVAEGLSDEIRRRRETEWTVDG